jgi:hypothetical protein
MRSAESDNLIQKAYPMTVTETIHKLPPSPKSVPVHVPVHVLVRVHEKEDDEL